MPTNFPGGIDSWPKPVPGPLPAGTPRNSAGDLGHAQQHINFIDAIIAIETYLKANPPSSIPIGVILIWSGSIATIPTGYALCDGTPPTPDLRDKFVVGASADSGGVAKTNIEGSLKQSGGLTGHSHSAHANLTHVGMTIGDHTGLTHGLTIANHPDLTHNALSDHASAADISFASQAIASGVDISAPTLQVPSHAAGSVPSQAIASGVDISAPTLQVPSHAAGSVPSQAIASGVDISAPSLSASHTTVAYSKGGTASNIVGALSGTIAAHTASRPSLPVASLANASAPTLLIAAHTASRPSLPVASVANASAPTLAVPSHLASRPSLPVASGLGSRPALTHNAISDHKGTDYGVHTFTAPPAHGVAGTLTHSFSEPSDHTISAHDTVSQVNPYFALAYIMKVT